MVGEPAEQRVRRSDGRTRERQVGAQFAGGEGEQVGPPTSGTNPIPVSGIAILDRSVTIRTEPWAERPTPPPITMPSMTAT